MLVKSPLCNCQAYTKHFKSGDEQRPWLSPGTDWEILEPIVCAGRVTPHGQAVRSFLGAFFITGLGTIFLPHNHLLAYSCHFW
jgi:hypothetical protein